MNRHHSSRVKTREQRETIGCLVERMKSVNRVRFLVGLTALTILALAPTCVFSTTIHVDAANAGDPVMDGSSAHPWDTMAKGIVQLASENAVTQGGHTVAVAPGVYAESVVLDISHSGVDGNPNTFLGDAAVIENTYPMKPGADWLVIDGFEFRGQTLGAIYATSGVFNNCIVQNCVFVGKDMFSDLREAAFYFYVAGENLLVRNCVMRNLGTGLDIARGGMTITVENCVFACGKGFGVRFRDSSLLTASLNVTVRDSIFYGLPRYAFCKESENGTIVSQNNCFYGNASGILRVTHEDLLFQEGDDLSSLASNPDYNFTGSIVALPGFAGLADDWDFGSFYSDSPCLGAGVSGGNLGAVASPSIVPVSANTYYVDAASGDDARSESEAANQSTPWATIQRAAQSAVAGDTVIIKPGVYVGGITITRGGSEASPVRYQAEPGVTVQGGVNGFELDRVGGVTLEGFTIEGASDGIRLYGSMGNIVRNCMIGNNSSDGIQLTYSMANVVERCEILENAAAGINCERWLPASVLADRCRIRGNAQGVFIGGYGSGSIIRNCCVDGNAAEGIKTDMPQYGGTAAPTTIDSCHIVGNGADGVRCRWDSINLRNTVIADNAVGIGEYHDAGTDPVVINCCLWNNEHQYFDEGVTFIDTASDILALDEVQDAIFVDPLFVDSAAADYRLGVGSPCINRGMDFDWMVSATDIAGSARILDGAVDIGAYEWAVGFLNMVQVSPESGVAPDYAFWINRNEITVLEFVEFLNGIDSAGSVSVQEGRVSDSTTGELYAMTTGAEPNACVAYDAQLPAGKRFFCVTGMAARPALFASWFAAAKYANWQSEKEGLVPVYDPASGWSAELSNSGYRLPTEAELLRAGSWNSARLNFYIYGTSSDTVDGSTANYMNSGDACEGDPVRSTPVGNYTASSPTGLKDVSGNAWEWCHGVYDPTDSNPAADPHVVLGGSWGNLAKDVKAASKTCFKPNQTLNTVGFRLVRR